MDLKTGDIQSLEWWSVREVAGHLRLSEDAILKMIHNGDLKAAKFLSVYRIHKSEIDRITAGAKADADVVSAAARKVVRVMRKQRRLVNVPNKLGDL